MEQISTKYHPAVARARGMNRRSRSSVRRSYRLPLAICDIRGRRIRWVGEPDIPGKRRSAFFSDSVATGDARHPLCLCPFLEMLCRRFGFCARTVDHHVAVMVGDRFPSGLAIWVRIACRTWKSMVSWGCGPKCSCTAMYCLEWNRG